MAGYPEIRRLRVLIVAAARLYREGIAQRARRSDPFEVVGSPARATPRWRACAPPLPMSSLVDLAMPGSLPLVSAMRADRPEVQVVQRCRCRRPSGRCSACAEAGAAGFVTLEESSLEDLCAILLSVGRGDALCPPWIAGALLRHVAALARGDAGTSGTDLTTREREVMELVDRGLSNKEIGRLLHIELPTVKNHVHNILRKLQVTRRSDAITRFRGVMVSARDDATKRADAFWPRAEVPVPRVPGC